MDDTEWESVLWCNESTLNSFLDIMDVVSSRLRRKRSVQIAASTRFKSWHLWWFGEVLVSSSVTTLLILKGTRRTWNDKCPHPDNTFLFFSLKGALLPSQGGQCYILDAWKKPGLWVKENESLLKMWQQKPQNAKEQKSQIKEKFVFNLEGPIFSRFFASRFLVEQSSMINYPKTL